MTDEDQYEDQACKDGPCDSAPLGCTDPNYCPKNRVTLRVIL
jgi:hypothetical protein